MIWLVKKKVLIFHVKLLIVPKLKPLENCEFIHLTIKKKCALHIGNLHLNQMGTIHPLLIKWFGPITLLIRLQTLVVTCNTQVLPLPN